MQEREEDGSSRRAENDSDRGVQRGHCVRNELVGDGARRLGDGLGRA